jgi:hypothetical protein
MDPHSLRRNDAVTEKDRLSHISIYEIVQQGGAALRTRGDFIVRISAQYLASR